MGETERGELVDRVQQAYYCANGHVTKHAFADGVQPPPQWDCAKCGLPAGTDADAPPPPPRIEPYKTHLAYVKERRSDADGAQLLEEALADLRRKRQPF
jgi:hypothetical protein